MEVFEPEGWIVVPIAKPDKTPIRTFMVQLAILSNHQNGRDTHVRLVKVYGPAAYVGVFNNETALKTPQCAPIGLEFPYH